MNLSQQDGVLWQKTFTLHLHLQLSWVPHCSHRLASLHFCPRQFLKISFSLSSQYLSVCLCILFSLRISINIYLYRYCCCCSFAKSCPTPCNPWTAACHTFLSFTISWSLLRLISIKLVMLSNHLILCCPLLLLPFPASGSFPMSWPKYWSFSFSISPSNEYSDLISFRIDWFDLLAV